MMKYKNTLSIIIITSSIMMTIFVGNTSAMETDYRLFASRIQEHFAPFQKTIITYIGTRYVRPLDNPIFQESISLMQDILNRRKNGTLSNIEAENLKNQTDESLLDSIQYLENLIRGHQYDFMKVLSTNGRQCRIDVFRPDGHPEYHYYLFNGINGYLITENDHVMRSGPNFTNSWLTPDNWVQYGFGIDRLLRQGYQIAQIDPEKRTFRIVNPEWKDDEYEFTLVQDNDLYWRQCDHWFKGRVIHRIICEDYEDHNGLWVPKTISTYKVFTQETVLEETMSLAEVQVNPGPMEDGYFSTPDIRTMTVRNINR